MHENLDRLYRFGIPAPTEQRFTYGKVFARQNRKGTPVLRIAADTEQIRLLELLMEDMREPLWLLYILLVPRADEGQPGRYQSADQFTKAEARAFLERFRLYLESDGRQSLWIKSVDSPDLLVYDKHNLVFAYGAVEQWAERLNHLGWQEVPEKDLHIPAPHMHRYHGLFDDDARKLLSDFNWVHSPLRESDDD